jgi:Family of unknown function (DUF6328)
MMIVLGLVIAPSAYHRIVAESNASQRVCEIVTALSAPMLVLFAMAIGLDLMTAFARISDLPAGIAAGIASAAIALAIWFGPLALKPRPPKRPMEAAATPIAAKIDYVLTEARIVLPGVQALLGFQLAIVFTIGFSELAPHLQVIHGLSAGLMTFAMVLLIAPAACHRIVYGGANTIDMYTVAQRFLMTATMFLALGVATDVYVVIVKTASNASAALLIALLTAATQIGMWLIWPWWMRMRASSTSRRRSGRRNA